MYEQEKGSVGYYHYMGLTLYPSVSRKVFSCWKHCLSQYVKFSNLEVDLNTLWGFHLFQIEYLYHNERWKRR
jgi:hypothetical protein